jgi:predicted polyphosphate/ATP-dependent NAD kinase
VNVQPARPGESLVGLVVNPRSGQDIRRLVARASVFPNTEKVMMLQRVLSSLGALGVERAVMAVDLGGIAAGLARAVDSHDPGRDGVWPAVDFLEVPLAGGAADSAMSARGLVDLGVRLLVVLGGDGTNRAVALVCGEVPLAALSTGTNNTFAKVEEATVAGMAAGLVATAKLSVADACSRSKVLVVAHESRHEVALVDVAVTTASGVGARAVWNPADLTELFVTFADPASIGLSSIAGLVRPVARDEPAGLRLALGRSTSRRVLAPIAPGLVREVGVEEVEVLRPDEARTTRASGGVIALDGEREIELRGEPAQITLSLDGPWRLDVERAMRVASTRHLLGPR